MSSVTAFLEKRVRRLKKTIDLKGLKCPLPAMRTRKMLKSLASGDLLTVECTDPLAAIDIPNLVRETGDTLEQTDRTDGLLSFHIRKR
jgi:tRNA 2-thiouridine synthesizing protein A